MLSRFICAGIIFATLQPAFAIEKQVPRSEAQIKYSYSPVVKNVSPAVVSIYALRVERARDILHPFFGFFHGMPEFSDNIIRERVERSLGSGVIVRGDGTIITNHHIIRGAKEIKVVLDDKREYDVEVFAEDLEGDLAILKIKSKEETFPYLELENSDSLEVGDLMLAIGNPFGLTHTVTSGIISAVGRAHPMGLKGQTYIQTDAVINPGNSGGGLVTMDGRLAGICTFILSKSGGSEGIGFVIPANALKPLLASLDQGGKIVRPWIGLSVQTITQAIAESLNLKRPGGVLIKNIVDGSPAKKMGLEPGDALMGMDGVPILDEEAFEAKIYSALVGTVISFEILKKNGQKIMTSIELISPPETPAKKPYTVEDLSNPLQGATFVSLSPAVAVELHLPQNLTGLVVYKVAPGSAAQRFGLVIGDIIQKINGVDIKDSTDLKKQFKRKLRAWQFLVKRGNQNISVTLTN